MTLLQTSVSYDPLEVILICGFDAQETFITINVKINFCFFFRILWWI